MYKILFSLFLTCTTLNAIENQEMCVTVDRSTGTYTVDQYGCVPTGIPNPIPAKK